jgi:hypothetical protein
MKKPRTIAGAIICITIDKTTQAPKSVQDIAFNSLTNHISVIFRDINDQVGCYDIPS